MRKKIFLFQPTNFQAITVKKFLELLFFQVFQIAVCLFIHVLFH
jgi:hypothetical protein